MALNNEAQKVMHDALEKRRSAELHRLQDMRLVDAVVECLRLRHEAGDYAPIGTRHYAVLFLVAAVCDSTPLPSQHGFQRKTWMIPYRKEKTLHYLCDMSREAWDESITALELHGCIESKQYSGVEPPVYYQFDSLFSVVLRKYEVPKG